MDKRRKEKHNYAVGQMEQKTGIVLDIDGEPYLGQGELYTYFDDIKSAKAFAKDMIRYDHRISCWIEDAKGHQILTMDRKGEHNN